MTAGRHDQTTPARRGQSPTPRGGETRCNHSHDGIGPGHLDFIAVEDAWSQLGQHFPELAGRFDRLAHQDIYAVLQCPDCRDEFSLSEHAAWRGLFAIPLILSSWGLLGHPTAMRRRDQSWWLIRHWVADTRDALEANRLPGVNLPVSSFMDWLCFDWADCREQLEDARQRFAFQHGRFAREFNGGGHEEGVGIEFAIARYRAWPRTGPQFRTSRAVFQRSLWPDGPVDEDDAAA